MNPVDILTHTPAWVYALLAGLTLLGLLQTRARERSIAGAIAPGILLAAWSGWSAHVQFPGAPVLATLAWIAGAIAVQPLGRRLATGLAIDGYDPVRRRVHVPGSWLPLWLILALFAIRYAANVAIAIQPALAGSSPLALGLGLAWGAIGGLFIARIVAIVRFLRRFESVRAGLAAAPR